MGFLADTPKPPYYAVIFSSIKGKYDKEYEHTAERMMNLAGGQPGIFRRGKRSGGKRLRHHGFLLGQPGGD